MKKERQTRPPAGEEEESADGRLQRSARSRAKIIDALLDLIREGELQPTGEQVATRADVGLRTIFRHFEDMESLYSETHARVTELVKPEALGWKTTGGRDERLRELVKRRSVLFEKIAPFKRSEQASRWRSALLQEHHEKMLTLLRKQLRSAIPEISDLPAAHQQATSARSSQAQW